jgi:hypothetical protein
MERLIPKIYDPFSSLLAYFFSKRLEPEALL